jgi:hypothetical protein
MRLFGECSVEKALGDTEEELETLEKRNLLLEQIVGLVKAREIEYHESYGWRVWTKSGWSARRPSLSSALRDAGYVEEAYLVESLP